MVASASTRLAAQTLPTTTVAEVKQAKIVATSSTATTVAEARLPGKEARAGSWFAKQTTAASHTVRINSAAVVATIGLIAVR